MVYTVHIERREVGQAKEVMVYVQSSSLYTDSPSSADKSILAVQCAFPR